MDEAGVQRDADCVEPGHRHDHVGEPRDYRLALTGDLQGKAAGSVGLDEQRRTFRGHPAQHLCVDA
jgi:hypothetical protein